MIKIGEVSHIPVLKVKLFGSPSVTLDGRVVALPYKKAEALLYYMILHKKTTRVELTGLLWPDVAPSVALKNLRHAIYSIRKELGCDPFSTGQRAHLELSSEVDIQCDVYDFLEKKKLSAYQDELLKDFSSPRAELFEQWLSEERTHLHTKYLRSLMAEEKEAFHAGDLVTAEKYGQKYVAADPLDEEAVTLLMQIYYAQQKFRKAIGAYHDLCESLSAELSISPLKETTALYYKIINDWNSATYKMEEQSKDLLVGKDFILRKLLALCNGTKNSRKTPCVLVDGAAGVGKTYLIDHTLNHYDFSDWLVCRSFCYQSEIHAHLAPWSAIMLTLLSEIEARHLNIPQTCLKAAATLFPCFSLSRDYVEHMGDLPSLVNYQTAMEGALLILSIVAREIPILMIFEDIHWMDKKSMDMLSLFLHRLHDQDVMVLCTSRNIFSPHEQQFIESAQRDKILERHSIQHFTKDETTQFLKYYMDSELPTEHLERIYQNTQGNALLLARLINTLQGANDLSCISQDPEVLLKYRLADLTAEERQVLDLISACMVWAPFDVLLSIMTKDTLELIYICDQLKQRLLITESLQGGVLCYALAHESIRPMLEQRQSLSGQRILHLRIARHLEMELSLGKPVQYDRLIHQYTAGGDRFNAFRYKVLSLNAYAGLCYDLFPTLSDRPYTAIPDEEGLLLYFRELEDELEELRISVADQTELDRLELLILHAKSRFSVHYGIYSTGLETLHRMILCCDVSQNKEMLVQAYLQMIYYGVQICNTTVMKKYLELGMVLLEGQEHTPEYGIYMRLNGLLHLLQGNYDQARKLLWQAIQIFQSLAPEMDSPYILNIAGVYNYIAEAYRLEGNFDEAVLYYDNAVLYNRKHRHCPDVGAFYTNYGVVAYQKGDRLSARMLFQYADECYRSSHEFSAYPITLSYLALFDVEDGNFELATQRIQEAYHINDMIASPWWQGITAYLTYHIRETLERSGQSFPALSALWPASKREHCLWALSYLRQLTPRLELKELEALLPTLPEE